jgi:hypothetical protein
MAAAIIRPPSSVERQADPVTHPVKQMFRTTQGEDAYIGCTTVDR